jgi:predicted tellurium resistance membrane protein TerC
VAFGTFLFFTEGTSKASEFFAGYLLEQSLSVDNLFVFVLIFNYFQVPQNYQSRVLMYGIAGAVVFRAIMIALGAATLQQFEAVNLVFAGILLFSSYKLFSDAEEGEEDLSDNFIIKISRMFVPITCTCASHRHHEFCFLTVVDFLCPVPLLSCLDSGYRHNFSLLMKWDFCIHC